MRVLQICPRLSWPPIDGGRLAMFMAARSLHRQGADLEIVSLNPARHRAAADSARGALGVPLTVIDVDTDRRVKPAIRALLTEVPYIAARFSFVEMEDALRAVLARRPFDIVQIESPFLLPYVPLIRTQSDARIVMRALNVEFTIWEQLAETERNVVRRSALRAVARSLRRYELRGLNECDAVLPISSSDATRMRELGYDGRIHVLPCGVDIEDYDVGRNAEQPATIGFLGSMSYRPNEQAARWIIDQLWPRLRETVPAVRLTIAGSAMPKRLRDQAAAAGVASMENVPDAKAFLRSQAIIIAPLFAGGGMRIKVLEAMALGRPVVATKCGAGGIDAVDGEEILIAATVDEFCDAISRCVRDPESARRIGDAGRRAVIERYDAGKLAQGVLQFYEELVVKTTKEPPPGTR